MRYEMTTQQLSRFLSRIDRDTSPNGCWLWTGAKTTAGYGETWNGKVIYAHRFAYEHWVGPIPEGLTIDHLCRVRHCINPAHLEACTMGVNVLRGTAPSANHARKTHCKRGHPFDEKNTYLNPTGKRVCLTCRSEYMSAYRDRNREQLKAYNKAWRAKNTPPRVNNTKSLRPVGRASNR